MVAVIAPEMEDVFTPTTRQAFRQAVATAADKARATLPESSSRIDKAVQLVLAGDVELLPDGHARVASQCQALQAVSTCTAVSTQVAAAAPPTLPEAPASVNCHVTIAGRQVQVTLRDTDETRLLSRLTTLLAQYPVEQAAPTSAPAPEGWCQVHQVQMRRNEKDGRSWWSHKAEDGSWCKGTAKGQGR